MWLQLVTGPQGTFWPPGLTAALCRPHGEDAARGVLRGGAQSLQRAGSISREAGRVGKKVQR